MISLEEFKKTTYQDWEAKTTEDLKGKDLHEVLDWKISESLRGQAYYDQSALEEAEYITNFFINFTPPKWKLFEKIESGNPATVNEEIVTALENGCDGIILKCDKTLHINDLEIMFKDVHTEICDISVDGINVKENTGVLSEYLIKSNKVLRGGLSFSETGHSQINLLRSHCIFDVDKSDPVEKTAIQLRKFVNLLEKEGEDLLKEVFFSVESQQNFYLGVVRPRAIRFLATAIANSMNLTIDPTAIYIHADPLPGKDYKESMLQNSVIGLANVIGGVNSISFDIGSEKPAGFSRRISRNIGNLLREESKLVFDKDPSAGSYFIDALTHQFCEEVWKRIS